MDEFTKTILLNKELIAVNQDPLGKQGYPLIKYQNIQFWIKPLTGGSWAIGIYNLSGKTVNVTNLRSEFRLKNYGKALIRDLWTHQTIGLFTDNFTCRVENHDVRVFRIDPAV
jgi:alpha-galactosidase